MTVKRDPDYDLDELLKSYRILISRVRAVAMERAHDIDALADAVETTFTRIREILAMAAKDDPARPGQQVVVISAVPDIDEFNDLMRRFCHDLRDELIGLSRSIATFKRSGIPLQ